jgi:hypothetical protein
MFTCIVLCGALLECQKNKVVHTKASESQLKVDRPDCSKYFNYKYDGGKNACGCAAMGRMVLTLPRFSDTCTYLMNTRNTLLESYQQRVYKITLATVNCQIQQAGNPTTAEVISTEGVYVDNAILPDYLTLEVAHEQPDIRSTDPNIPIRNNCTCHKLPFGMPRHSEDYAGEGDKIEEHNTFPTASQR